MADRLARRLQHGEVDEDTQADDAEQKAETAEQVERSVPVAPDERHRQQVEKPPEVALRAVARASLRAGAVIDRDFSDAKASVVREHRQEAVQLAVDAEALEDAGSIRLQSAVEVVQPETRDAARGDVEELGEDAPQARVPPSRLPAGDEVEPLVELDQ